MAIQTSHRADSQPSLNTPAQKKQLSLVELDRIYDENPLFRVGFRRDDPFTQEMLKKGVIAEEDLVN